MLETLRYNSIVGLSAPVLCKVSLSCSQLWATVGHGDSSCYSQSPHAISFLYMFIKMTHIPYPVQHTSTWAKSSDSKAFWSNVTEVHGLQNLSDSQDSLFGVLILYTSPSNPVAKPKIGTKCCGITVPYWCLGYLTLPVDLCWSISFSLKIKTTFCSKYGNLLSKRKPISF